MGRYRLVVLVAAAAVLIVAATTAVSAGGRPFSTDLNPAEEVDAQGVPNQGDPDASGSAQLQLNPGRGQVCFHVVVRNTSDILFGHIHEAPAGVNGPVDITLFHFGTENPSADREFSGCVDADRDAIQEIIRAPQNYYVNVHSTEKPAGAVRGQLGD